LFKHPSYDDIHELFRAKCQGRSPNLLELLERRDKGAGDTLYLEDVARLLEDFLGVGCAIIQHAAVLSNVSVEDIVKLAPQSPFAAPPDEE
jgi:hypothetical protein